MKLAGFNALGRLKDPHRFGAWLYRIARNKALQSYRKGQEWRTLADETAAVETTPEAPEGAIIDTTMIHAGLDRLSPGHREVLILRFLDGLTYAEIMQVLGCPLGTVRSRVHYAKQALRRELENIS